MKRVKNMKTTTYEDGMFLIDIVETESDWDMYISVKNWCAKSFCFGLAKNFVNGYGEEKTVTRAEFMETVKANLAYEKAAYLDDNDDDCHWYTVRKKYAKELGLVHGEAMTFKEICSFAIKNRMYTNHIFFMFEEIVDED